MVLPGYVAEKVITERTDHQRYGAPTPPAPAVGAQMFPMRVPHTVTGRPGCDMRALVGAMNLRWLCPIC